MTFKNSTEYLRFIVQNDLHLVDVTGLKRFIAVRAADGHSVGPRVRGGDRLVEVPAAMLDDLLAQHYVADSGVNKNGNAVYRPTMDGQIRGHSTRTALRKIAEHVTANCDGFVTSGLALPSPSERDEIRGKILDLAVEIDRLAGDRERITHAEVEEPFAQLRGLGLSPPTHLVSAVAHAIEWEKRSTTAAT